MAGSSASLQELQESSEPALAAGFRNGRTMPSSTDRALVTDNGQLDRPFVLLIVLGLIAVALIAAVTSIVWDKDGASEQQVPKSEISVLNAAPLVVSPFVSLDSDGAGAEDAWKSPVRSVFLIDGGVEANTRSVLESALNAGPLKVIERERLEALVREQDLAAEGRVDRNSAIQLGGLLGGHIAIVANQIEDQVALRSVIVETGELASVELVPVKEAFSAVNEILAATCKRLGARGLMQRNDSGAGHMIDVGSYQGVLVGDRFAIVRPDEARMTEMQAELRVIEVKPNSARVVSADERSLPMRGYVRKILP